MKSKTEMYSIIKFFPVWMWVFSLFFSGSLAFADGKPKGATDKQKDPVKAPKKVPKITREFFQLVNHLGKEDGLIRQKALDQLFQTPSIWLPLFMEALKNPPRKWKHLLPYVIEGVSYLFGEEGAPLILKIARHQYQGEFSFRISQDTNLYTRALEALGRLRYLKAKPFLFEILEKSKIPLFREKAFQALVEMVSRPFSQAVRKHLVASFFREPSHSVLRQKIGRFLEEGGFSPDQMLKSLPPDQCCSLLGNYTSPKSLEALYSLAQKYYDSIRAAAIIEIGRRKGTQYLPFIQKCLLSSDEKVEMAALYALDQFHQRKIYPILKQYAFWKGESRQGLVAPAILRILKSGDREMVYYYLTCLESRDPFLKKIALRALQILEFPEVNGVLFPYMYSSDPQIAISVAETLAKRGKAEAVSRLEKLGELYKNNPLLSLQVAFAQARSGNVRALQMLEKKAFDEKGSTPEVSYAVDRLKALGSSKVSALALKHYKRGGPLRVRAIQILEGHLDPSYRPFLFGCLADPYLYVRFQALRYLQGLSDGYHPSPGEVEKIFPLLHHPYTSLLAQNLLVRWKKEAGPRVLGRLKDPDPLHLRDLLLLLARYKDPLPQKSLERVLALARHENSFVRGACAQVLVFQGKESFDRVLKLAKDPSFFVRMLVMEALGNNRSKDGILVLIRALGDPHLGVRIWALRSLRGFHPSSDLGYHPRGREKAREKAMGEWKKWAGEK